MKALSLIQPWASLIAFGEKTIETRSWGTSHRGRIAIHASARIPREVRDEVGDDHDFLDALGRHDVTLRHLPLGAVVATASLVDCFPMTPGYVRLAGRTDELETAFGNFAPGRYAWVLEEVRALDEPIPAKGALGLWEWDEAQP